MHIVIAAIGTALFLTVLTLAAKAAMRRRGKKRWHV